MANIFSDDFNRADAASLGANWTEAVGDVRINTNRVDNVSTTECVTLYSGTVTPDDDYSVSADLLITTGTNNSGIIGRYTDNSNYYHARILAGTGLQLFSKTAGGLTSIGSYATTISTGVTYTVKLEMVSSTIKVYLDDVERISVSNSDHASGNKAGIRINNGAANAGTVDNFSIDEIEQEESRSSASTRTAAGTRQAATGRVAAGARTLFNLAVGAALLLEDEFRLLLETGDVLLME